MNTDPYSQPPSTGQEHLSQLSQPSSTGSEFPATNMGMAASQGVTSLPTSTYAAPVHSQGHEVTQFCPMPGCTYTFYPTRDPNMLVLCLNQITVQMKYTHDVTSSS